MANWLWHKPQEQVGMHAYLYLYMYDLAFYFNKRINFERVLEGLCRMKPTTPPSLAILGEKSWV